MSWIGSFPPTGRFMLLAMSLCWETYTFCALIWRHPQTFWGCVEEHDSSLRAMVSGQHSCFLRSESWWLDSEVSTSLKPCNLQEYQESCFWKIGWKWLKPFCGYRACVSKARKTEDDLGESANLQMKADEERSLESISLWYVLMTFKCSKHGTALFMRYHCIAMHMESEAGACKAKQRNWTGRNRFLRRKWSVYIVSCWHHSDCRRVHGWPWLTVHLPLAKRLILLGTVGRMFADCHKHGWFSMVFMFRFAGQVAEGPHHQSPLVPPTISACLVSW